MHSHLIPGIDDGAKTLEESLALILQLQDLGYKKLYTTPHVMADLYPNTTKDIQKGAAILRASLKENNIDLDIQAAAEYLIDDGFEEKIKQEDLLTLPGRRVLVEMSFISPPSNLDRVIFLLQTKKYHPVIAHPERYLFYRNQLSKYRELKDRGCELQVNLLSLIGYYGKPAKDIAFHLFKSGLVDFVGTDLHHSRHADQLQSVLNDRKVASLLNEYVLKNSEL